MRSAARTATLLLIPLVLSGLAAGGNGGRPDRPWRTLPLVTDGKVDGNWTHVGGGGFAVEDGGLRTECDEKGLGLLLYGREKFGDCQIRVVYRAKDQEFHGVRRGAATVGGGVAEGVPSLPLVPSRQQPCRGHVRL